MSPTSPPLFSTDRGHIMDFTGKRSADIFNSSVIPRVNSFLDLVGDDPGGLNEGAARREQELEMRAGDLLAKRSRNDEFFAQPAKEPDFGVVTSDDLSTYNEPTSPKRQRVFPTTHPSVKNKDGTSSNVVMASFEQDGKEYVIPTMVGGKQLDIDAAVSLARKQGLDKYPSFASSEEATAWTKANHGKIDPDGYLNEPQGAQVREAHTSKNLTDFVKHFEGFNPKAYGDFKQNSIGYGTRARKGETTISKEDAEVRLGEELNKARSEVEALNEKHGYDFTDHQKDALTSFAYNVGNVNKLSDGGKRDKDMIAKKILEYTKAGGKTLPGLVKRREAEHKLFTQGY